MKTRSALERYASFVARRPVPVLLAAAAILALSLWAASGIVLRTNISDMLPKDNPTAASYKAITSAFSTTSSLMVLVKGPDRPALIAAAEDFAARLRADKALAPYVRSVRMRMDADFVKDWGLLLQEPSDIDDTAKMLRNAGLLPLVTAVNDEFESMLGGENSNSELDSVEEEDGAVELMTRIELFAEGLRAAIEAGPAAAAGSGGALAEAFLVGDGYLVDAEGRALLFTVTPTFDLGDRKALTGLVDGARRIAAEVEKACPGSSFGFTGDVASESDEEKALGFDTFFPSLVAYAAVFVLFFASFARSRSVAFALVSLASGILVDLGFAGLAIGELNMITSAFGSILVGLGIDFGIHVVSRYDEVLSRGGTAHQAVSEAVSETLLPVATGALTTAAAFFALLVSKTAAFRQFGLVAGFGIVMTLVAMYTILPALLAAFGGGTVGRRRPVLDYSFTGKIADWSARRPVPVLGLTAALVCLALFGIRLSRFEYDMRTVGPTGTEAQVTEAEVLERFDLSPYTVLALAGDLESVRAMEEKVRDLPAVRRVESVADYLPSPAEQDERLAAIGRMAARPPRVESAAWDAATVELLAAETERLEDNLIELGDLAAASRGEDSPVLRKRSAMIREIFGAESGRPGAEVLARLAAAIREPGTPAALAAADASFGPALSILVRRLSSPNRRMTEADLPPDALGDFKSRDGASYLLVAYPDRGIADEAALIAFGEGIARISPSLTGSLQLGVELGRVVVGEAWRCAILVAAAVTVLVLAGFRSAKLTLLSLSGLAAGMALGFGIYPLAGSYNIVNVLAVPLIIGIGIDYCIHIIHNVGRGLSVRRAMDRIGRAIILSSATTMIGFGSLALMGRYRGVASLGRLLFIGVGACLFVAMVVMPAALGFAARRASRGEVEAGAGTIS